MQFADFDLPEVINTNIKSCGWEIPTPIQQLVIPKACEGFDILGGAPTGTGKSAAFLIPLVFRLLQKKKKRYTSFNSRTISRISPASSRGL